MEGLWDLPDVLGEMSCWGLRPSQLQLLSLWRTPRGSLRGERMDCVIVVRTKLEKSNSGTMSRPTQSHYRQWGSTKGLCWHARTESSSNYSIGSESVIMHASSTNLSKDDWYNGVGELLGLCLQGLWGKLPTKQAYNVQNKHLTAGTHIKED